MMKKIEYRDRINELYVRLRDVFFHKNIGFSIIRLVFIKYAVDNCIGAHTKEDMQWHMKFQSLLAARNIGLGPNGLVPILNMIDNEYGLDRILHNSITAYTEELFGFDRNLQRKNVPEKYFERVMACLASLDLMDNDEHEKGKDLVKILMNNFDLYSERGYSSSEYYSRNEIGKITNRILNVQDGETYLDFASGIGSTTIANVGDKECNIINSDINVEAVSVSAMLYIMYGYRNFSIENTSYLPLEGMGAFSRLSFMNDEYIKVENVIDPKKADKIFVDPPWGMRVPSHELRDSTSIAIRMAMDSLNEKGMAILSVPSGDLLGGKALRIRLEMLDRQYIKGVITLPITALRTAMTVNLIVLSKNEEGKVTFVNGCSEAFKKFVLTSKQVKAEKTITQDGIELISDIINQQLEIEGISRNVSYNEIVDADANFSPIRYVAEKREESGVNITDIDKELEELYKKLMTLI